MNNAKLFAWILILSISIQWGESIFYKSLKIYHTNFISMNARESLLSKKIWDSSSRDVNVKIHAVSLPDQEVPEFNRTAPVIFTHELEGEKVYFSFRTSSFRIIMQDPMPNDLAGFPPGSSGSSSGNGDPVCSDYYFDQIQQISFLHDNLSAKMWHEMLLKSLCFQDILHPPPNIA